MRRFLVLASSLAVVLTACGGDAEPTTTTTTAGTVTTTQAPGATTTEAPVSSDPGRTPVDGDTVGVFYTGTLDDGEQFDSNVGRDPLTFVVGSGQVISGFDDAVRGLTTGESVTVRLEPSEAYGERNPDLIIEVPRDGSEPDFEVGEQAIFGGQQVTIVEIRDDVIVIDANHRLAGEALTFEIELVSIT
jgi:peptidylprolyl isomerase